MPNALRFPSFGTFGRPKKKADQAGLTPEDKSLLRRVGEGTLSLVEVAGDVFDTPQQIIRSLIMYGIKGDNRYLEDIWKAMVPFRSKFGIDDKHFASWEDVLAQFGISKGWERTVLAFGIGVAGDFLILPSTLSLTGKGVRAAKGIKGAGELGATWAEQAAQGQRVLFHWPILSKMVGADVSVGGTKVVAATGHAGAVARDFVRSLFGISNADPALRKAMSKAAGIEKLAAKEVNQGIDYIRAAALAAQTGAVDTVAREVEVAHMAQAVPLLLKPYKTGHFYAAFPYGVTKVTDDILMKHVRLMQGAVRLGKRGSGIAGPSIKAYAKSVARTLKMSDEPPLIDFVTHVGSDAFAKALAEELGVRVLPRKEWSDIAGKTVLVVRSVVGPEIEARGPMKRLLKKLSKAGANTLQAGIAYAPKGVQAIEYAGNITKATETELFMLGRLYEYINQLDGIAALKDATGEDLFKMLAKYEGDKEHLAVLLNKPVEELTGPERAWRAFQEQMQETFLTEVKNGAPVRHLNKDIKALVSYAPHMWTPEGLKALEQLKRDPKLLAKAAKVWRAPIDRDLLMKTSLDARAYVPWKRVPHYLKDFFRNLVSDDTYKWLEENGVHNEIMSIFGGPFNIHYSMIDRIPLTQNATIAEINAFMAEHFGVEKAMVDDPFALLAIRIGRHHRFMTAHQGVIDLAKKYGAERPLTRVASEIAQDMHDGAFHSAAVDNLMENVNSNTTYVFRDKLIAQAIDRHWSIMNNGYSASKFYHAYMSVLRWWKSWTLFPWMQYHTRNMFTDLYRLQLTGVDVINNPTKFVDLMKQARDLLGGKPGYIITKAGEKIPFAKVRKEVPHLFEMTGMVTGAADDITRIASGTPESTWMAEVKRQWGLYKGGKRAAKNVAKFLLSGTGNPLGFYGAKFAHAWEGMTRAAAFIDQVEKGADMAKALGWVAHWMIDYNDLSLVEQKWGKALIPFYSWMRHNIPLAIETIFKYPQIYDTISRAQMAVNGQLASDIELEALPPYIKEGIHFRLPTSDKEIPQYLISIGMPEEDLNFLLSIGEGPVRTLQELTAQLSPMLRMIPELAGKRYMYFDEPIENYRTAYSYIQDLPKPIQDALGYFEYEDTKGRKHMIMNPWMLYMMSQFRAFKEFSRAMDERMTIARRLVNIASGARIASVDIDLRIQRILADQRDKTLKEAAARGMVRHFQRFYVPKEWRDRKLPEDVQKALESY